MSATGGIAAQADTEKTLPDARPSERLLSLLMLVQRTVLPRHVELKTDDTAVGLDLASQRLQLGVRAGNHFFIDDTLATAAPAAHKLLRRRARGVIRHDETLRDHQAALCACAARALLRFCAEGEPRYRINAAPLEEAWAAASFSVMDLYEAAREQAMQAGRGPVRAFFDTVRAKMDEAWLLSQDGWIVEAPADARGLAQYAEVTKTARLLAAWRDAASDAGTPQLAYATRPPHDWIWSIASDANHIALLRCSPLKWAATLSAWSDYAGASDVES
ncbi:hypothetical protein [Dichotomicrobium thermohalophilum]|uniref:Uncharacterized protein n=1 Tax=Dichotomicrobium thermohalophilum TaxID=933063 RepID=A0A397Q7U5_9HYPH|nr:hypothetical protein [Dichotomicrobium thermohalophilum]RIA56559.1 hypothetical protein BXY53_1665 [Dichotomicrobium thermohalophilum]